MGDFEKALMEYDKAISINPNNYFYYGAKSALLCDMVHRYEDALITVNKGLEINDKVKRLIQNKFIILLKMSNNDKNLQEVLNEINKLIRDESEFSKFFGLKSKVLYDLGKKNEAKVSMEKAIKLDPKEIFNYQIQFQNLEGLYSHEETLTLLEQALQSNQDNLALLNSKLYTLARLNKEREALITAEKLLKIDPKEGNSYDSYGEVLLMFKKYDKALEMLNKAIEIDPNATYIHETYTKIGECLLKMGNYDKALENLGKGKKFAEERKDDKIVDKANRLISEVKEIKSEIN